VGRARRKVLLLALCQAALIGTAALMSTIGTLAGHASGSGSARQSRSASPPSAPAWPRANDFLIWTTVAVTSLSSGQLLHRHGWAAVLVTAAPLLGLAAAVLAALSISGRTAAPSPRQA
jgi:hypothetical protein